MSAWPGPKPRPLLFAYRLDRRYSFLCFYALNASLLNRFFRRSARTLAGEPSEWVLVGTAPTGAGTTARLVLSSDN
jgi:hypothetical protein